MQAKIESTSKVVTLNGVPARIWEGQTESGVKILCYITRVAISKNEPTNEELEEFKRELDEQRSPSVVAAAIPLNLIL